MLPMNAFKSSTNSNKPNSDKSSELQIFLGGSCNPTTWRQNVAIPYLQMNGISYYNPQIDNWTPEVVHIERQAKRSAKYLLFVIDKQTRSTVSLVESAFIAGDDKNLVLVICPYSGELAGLEETYELRQARYLLRSLVSKQRIPMFNDILQALDHITKRLKKEINHKQSLPLNEDTPDTDNQSRAGDVLDSLQPRSIENSFQGEGESSHDIGQLRDVYLSLDSDDEACLKSVIPLLEENGLTYKCMSVNSLTNPDATPKEKPSFATGIAVDSERSSTNSYAAHRGFSDMEIERNVEGAIDKEICAIRNSRVLLFVITNKCRGLSIMVLASHFMARFRNSVVLCIQELEEPCCIGGETLTKNAVADYNRGRVYLNDYAVESRVPVFSTIKEAIECCSRKCGYNNNT